MVDAAELTDPVAYSRWWALLAAVLPLLVVAWYAAVTRWTRDRRPIGGRAGRRLAAVRREHLERLDRLEAAAVTGDLSLRSAHQSISEIVRSFVAEVGPVDARTMALDQLRVSTPGQVVEVVEIVYPAEFAPGNQGSPGERLAPALRHARALVATWTP